MGDQDTSSVTENDRKALSKMTASTCPELKLKYEKCFQKWAAESLLQGEAKDDPCQELFVQYRQCVRQDLENRGILEDIQRINQELQTSPELASGHQTAD
ncbi:MAG: hypothetical protein MHM6MM_008977 [Cercozoa sp. M6MM]